MPYYCTVPRCTSMAGKAKNVSFHQFPRDEELAKLWNKILKRGKPYTKYSKVCSLHFTAEDYTITSVGKNKGQWRTLRKDAIPSQNLPSESPTPYQRKQWGSWTHNAPVNVLDPTIHHQVAQAIYMQTMLAMQAAGAADVPTYNHSNGLPQQPTTEAPFAHTSNTTDTDILKGKQTNTSEKSTSYKCTECSKCFKDPDVFILHKRSHMKNEKNEKENFNLNLTLQANPILANLLKTNTENTNIFDGNLISVESLLMTALAANMEGYMRNFTSMIKSDDRANMGHDRANLSHGRANLNNNCSNYLQGRLDLSSRSSYIEDREDETQRAGLSCDRSIDNDSGDIDRDRGDMAHERGDMTHDRGDMGHERGDMAHDITATSMGNRHSDSNVIRDRIIALYRNNDSDRNIRYYENDEHNRGCRNSGRVTNYDGRGMMNRDRVTNDDDAMNHDRGVINDNGYNDGITNDDDDSQGTDEPSCDSDLNESIDSNKLVIDETI